MTETGVAAGAFLFWYLQHVRNLPELSSWTDADKSRLVSKFVWLVTLSSIAGNFLAALLARHHKQLSQHFRVTTPPWQVFRWAYDKRLTYHLAGRLGIGYPWTRYPRDRATVARTPVG